MDTSQNPGYVSRVRGFLAHPFTSNMDAVSWFLFVGLLLLICAGWRVILSYITESV